MKTVLQWAFLTPLMSSGVITYSMVLAAVTPVWPAGAVLFGLITVTILLMVRGGRD